MTFREWVQAGKAKGLPAKATLNPTQISKSTLPEYVGVEHAAYLMGDDINIAASEFRVTGYISQASVVSPIGFYRGNPLNRVSVQGTVIGDAGRLMLDNPFRSQAYSGYDYVLSNGMMSPVAVAYSTIQRISVPTSLTITSPQLYLSQLSVQERLSAMLAQAMTLSAGNQVPMLTSAANMALSLGTSARDQVSSFAAAVRSAQVAAVGTAFGDLVVSPLENWQSALSSANSALGASVLQGAATSMIDTLSTALGLATEDSVRSAVSQAFAVYSPGRALTALDGYSTMLGTVKALGPDKAVSSALTLANGIWISARDMASQAFQAMVSAIPAVPSAIDVTAHWSSVAAQADAVIQTLAGPSVSARSTADFLVAQELNAYPAFARTAARFKRGMADIGAVNGSAFVMGLANLENAYAQQNLEVRGRLTTEAYRACLDYLAQTTNSALQYELAEKNQIRDYRLGILQANASMGATRAGLVQALVGASAQASSDWLRAYETGLAAVRAEVEAALATEQGTAQWALEVGKVSVGLRSAVLEGLANEARTYADMASAAASAQAATTGSFASAYGSSLDTLAKADSATAQLYGVAADGVRVGASQATDAYRTILQGITGHVGLLATGVEASLTAAKTYVTAQNAYEVQMAQLIEKDIKWVCDSWGVIGSFLGVTGAAPHLSGQWQPSTAFGDTMGGILGVAGAVAQIVNLFSGSSTTTIKK